MFNKDFFPTPYNVIETMLEGIDLSSKVVYEPSSGKGDIIDYLIAHNVKDVIASELNPELRTITASKCRVIAGDFLQVTSDMISHINMIVMNPPFSADEHHIIHAYNIAPAGCTIKALCNLNTIKEKHNRYRRELGSIVDTYGSYVNLGNCFSDSERATGVEVALITIHKGGVNYEHEFEGFFTEEEVEQQGYGIMPYNFVRDLVNRYVGAVKIFDEQLDAAMRLNELTGTFFSTKIALSITSEDKPKSRNDFKKELQKSAWDFIFEKMNMGKYATKGLKEDINKFVEQQEQVPFTMRNIYRMLDIVIGTTAQRMDKALIEVFDKLTQHYHENRYSVEGWKTNSHYLVNQKFILNNMCSSSTGSKVYTGYSCDGNFALIEDFTKALCYITGNNYDNYQSLFERVSYPIRVKDIDTGEFYSDTYTSLERYYSSSWQYKNKRVEPVHQGDVLYGEWFDWGFFSVRFYKKGTAHFKFKDPDVWARFNQHIARIKGYPLFEPAHRQGHKKAA